MSITERLANLDIKTVIITIVVLFAIRYILLKQRTPVAKSIAEIAESLAVAMGLVFLLIRPFIVQAFFIPSASMHPTLLEQDHILVNKFIYRFREPRLGDVVVFRAPEEATGVGEEKDFIKRVIGVPGDVVKITPGYVRIGEQEFRHTDLEQLFSTGTGDLRIRLLGNKVYVNDDAKTPEEIAAMANEPDAKVKVIPGKVYINGKPINEPYIAEDPDAAYPSASTPDEWIVKDKKGDLAVKIPKAKLLVMGDNRNDSNDSRFWGLLDRDRVLGKAMFIFWPVTRIRWVH